MSPLSGTGSWIELLVVLSAGVVGTVYVWQVFLPRIKVLLGSEPDYEQRTAALLDRYQAQQQDTPPDVEGDEFSEGPPGL